MEKKFYLKNGGFPPINFCIKKEEDTKKERFFQSNLVHNINIRQLLMENKKPIIVPVEEDALELVDTFNKS